MVSRSGRHGIAAVTGLLGLMTLVVAVLLAWLAKGPEAAAIAAGLVGVPIAVVQAAIQLVVWWRRSVVPATTGTAKVLQAKDVLAKQVEDQWKTEARLRSLYDPDPIPVRWRTHQVSTASTALMDHPANIEPAGASTVGGMWRAASSADIGTLADRFRHTRRRRLVILGGPGTGKTTLAMQLLLHLLDTRTPDEPVPVLLPVTGWDTEQFPRLHDWLADRLARDYPALRSPELGVEVVRTLTRRGHILPILDGLDELPSSAQATVITHLNRSLGGDDQLILTSRTTEFTTAVTAAGDVVTSAAVLEPRPLDAAAAADYLTRCLPPSPGATWQQILTDLRNAQPTNQDAPDSRPNGTTAALASIAATPLGLWLLRTVYVAPGADPTELADPARFPTPAALRAHLFDQIIPTLIERRRPSNDPAELFLPRHAYVPEKVRDWLGYLADHLNRIPSGNGQTGTRDFAWWDLARYAYPPRTLPGRTESWIPGGLVFGFAGMLIGILAGGLVLGTIGQPGYSFASGLAVATFFALYVAFSLGLVGMLLTPYWLKESPGFTDRHVIRDALPPPLPKFASTRGRIIWVALLILNPFAFLFALPVRYVVLVIRWLYAAEIPSVAGQANTPMTVYQADRSLNIFRCITVALAFGLLPGLWFGIGVGVQEWFTLKYAIWIVIGPALGLLGGSVIGLFLGKHHAWLLHVLATYLLSRGHRLPRRLMPFLDDMHRLGLLRAVGPIYQFRHAELQDHLAAAYRLVGRSRPPG